MMTDNEDLPLSPSERAGINAAQRISGHRGGRSSTQGSLGSIILGFEIIVIFLTGLTTFGLRVFDPPTIGIWGGVSVCLLAVIALALMRTRAGIFLGWIVQAVVLLSAIFLPAILLVGIPFAIIYGYGMIKGAQIDRQRAQWRAEGLIP